MRSGLSALATKGIFIRLSISNWKVQSRADETSFNTTLGIASRGDGSEIERTNCQRIRDEDDSYSFWSDSTIILQCIHSSHCKQQEVVANRVAEILDTTDISQWKHVSGINNPADIGTRAIYVDELKRSEWLNGPARLKQPESEWPEHFNLFFAADEENTPTSTFITQAEEKKPIVQWGRFSKFNRLVNTIATCSIKKPATKMIGIEENEVAKATIFRLLQQFAEEMKSLKAEKEIPKGSKIYSFHLSLTKGDLFAPKAE